MTGVGAGAAVAAAREVAGAGRGRQVGVPACPGECSGLDWAGGHPAPAPDPAPAPPPAAAPPPGRGRNAAPRSLSCPGCPRRPPGSPRQTLAGAAAGSLT